MLRHRGSKAVLVVLGFVVCALVLVHRVRSGPAEEADEAWVSMQWRALQLTREERRYEDVIWTYDILEALDSARRNRRPVVMFCNDGPLGRCGEGGTIARVTSFADSRVARLLNEACVPYFHDNDIYTFAYYKTRPGGPMEQKRWSALCRIRRMELAAGLVLDNVRSDQLGDSEVKLQVGSMDEVVGPVHVALLTPDGVVVPGSLMRLRELHDPAHLLPVVRRIVARTGTQPGPPAVRPVRHPAERAASPDDLVLHVVSRFKVGRADLRRHLATLNVAYGKGYKAEYAPPDVLTNRVAAPGQEHLVLQKREWLQLVCGRPVDLSSWDVPAEVAAKILVHLGVQGESYQFDVDRIKQLVMKARVVSSTASVTQVCLTGSFQMWQPWWNAQDDESVQASYVGYAAYDRVAGRVNSFCLVTRSAHYLGGVIRPAVRIPYAAGACMFNEGGAHQAGCRCGGRNRT